MSGFRQREFMVVAGTAATTWWRVGVGVPTTPESRRLRA